ERTMKTDDAGYVGSTARELQRGCAAEAETDGADATRIQRCVLGLRTQHVERLLDPRAQFVAIGVKRLDLCHCLRIILRMDALAIDIGDQDDVTGSGKLPRRVDCIVTDA